MLYIYTVQYEGGSGWNEASKRSANHIQTYLIISTTFSLT